MPVTQLQLVIELTKMILVVGFAQYTHAKQVVTVAHTKSATIVTRTVFVVEYVMYCNVKEDNFKAS